MATKRKKKNPVIKKIEHIEGLAKKRTAAKLWNYVLKEINRGCINGGRAKYSPSLLHEEVWGDFLLKPLSEKDKHRLVIFKPSDLVNARVYKTVDEAEENIEKDFDWVFSLSYDIGQKYGDWAFGALFKEGGCCKNKLDPAEELYYLCLNDLVIDDMKPEFFTWQEIVDNFKINVKTGEVKTQLVYE